MPVKPLSILLQTHEAYLAKILDSPGLIIFSLDMQYCYTAFNSLHRATMKAIWGVDIMLGMNMLHCIARAEDCAKAKANFDRALAGEEFVVIEEYGDELLMRTWYEDSYSPQRDAEGEAEGVSVFVKDITRQKLFEAQLHIKNTQLEHLNEELNALIYRTSHDLRAPVASLMGLVGLMEESKEDERKFYTDMMTRQLLHLDETIRDIITFRKIGASTLAPEDIDLAAMIRETIQGLQFADSYAEIDKQISLPEHAVFSTDKYYLSIVINNLLSNAFKYADAAKSNRFVSVSLVIGEQKATLAIADNGIGIDPEYQQKVFDMFFRASTQSSGTGIGLHIVQEAVQKLNGRIALESVLGKGSTFTVTLPALD